MLNKSNNHWIGVVALCGLVGCAAPGGSQPAGSPSGAATDAAQRKAVKVTQTADGVVISSDERILFDTGKSVIRDGGQVYVDRVSKMVQEQSKASIRIEGHTDNVGSADLNARLSEARAQSVKSALVKAGVDGQRMTAKGFGFTRPIADNGTNEGRQINRRTEILLVGEKIENVGGAAQADRLSDGFANFLKDPLGTIKGLLSQ